MTLIRKTDHEQVDDPLRQCSTSVNQLRTTQRCFLRSHSSIRNFDLFHVIKSHFHMLGLSLLLNGRRVGTWMQENIRIHMGQISAIMNFSVVVHVTTSSIFKLILWSRNAFASAQRRLDDVWVRCVSTVFCVMRKSDIKKKEVLFF